MNFKSLVNSQYFGALIFVIIIVLEFIVTSIFNKKCHSSHIKIIFSKISLVLSVSILIISVLYALFLSIILKLDCSERFDLTLLGFLFLILGVPGAHLMTIGNIDLTKQNIYDIPYRTYQEWSKFINSKLLKEGYERRYSEEDLKIYTKQKKGLIKVCVSTEIENVTLEKINETYLKIREILSEEFNYVESHLWSKMMITFIISTNKNTPDFNRFIKSIDIDKRIIKLPVGISYGGKKLYISNAIDGFDMPYQNKMYKEFMKLIDIVDKRR